MSPSTTSAGPARLGLLLSEAVAYYKAHWQSLLVGAVVFGLIMGVTQATIGAKTALTVGQGMNNMGMDTQRMEDLSARIEAGDEAAVAELEVLMRESFGDLSDDQAMAAGMGMMGDLAPALGLGMLVSILLGILAHAYYSLVAVEGKDIAGTLSRLPKVFLPLAGVSIWCFLRSFAWLIFVGPLLALIPGGIVLSVPLTILGIVLAIIFGPRFVAAPLIFLAEGKGVVGSVNESHRRTRGYWGKIVGNGLVAALCTMVVSMIIGMIIALVFSKMSMAGIVVHQVVGQLIMAFMTVFMIRLSHTILQNPRA